MGNMARIETPWGPWEPASLDEVAAIFSAFGAPWWIAGGYAIELAVGEAIRDHGDIDVLVLRPDQLRVQRVLSGWEWWAADPPGTLRPWRRDEMLPAHVHDIWCRSGPQEPWRIQVMLDEAVGNEWVSRRAPGIRRTIDSLGAISVDGIPYLVPEIQLFYKARQPRSKDHCDFAAALRVLTSHQREWLIAAIRVSYGENHPWQSRLIAGSVG